MESGRFLENSRRISFAIVLSFLIPALAYYKARFIVNYLTGTALGKVQNEVGSLQRQVNETETNRGETRKMLNRGELSSEKKFKLELDKKKLEQNIQVINDTLSAKKLTEKERKEIEDKIQSLDQLYGTAVKDLAEKEAQNKAARDKQDRIFFWVTTLCGLIALGLGYFTRLAYLGAGFIVGGAVTIVGGFSLYWHHLNDLLRLGAISFTVLVVIASAYGLARRDNSN